ncbi:ribonuclease H-like domain-containing protein [Tanacetum coccineum]
MFTCTLAQYVAYKTNVAQQFTPQKHYRLPHPGQGILGPAPAIYASQPTPLPSAFSTMPLQDPTWHMDTGASSHLNFNASNLSTIFDKRLFPSVHVGDGKSIPVTNTGHSIIPSHHRPLHLHNVLLFKHKFHVDGTLSRYKARLVANGSSQQLGVNFDETFSPVKKPATIRTVLSLVVSRQWPIHQLDVKNAFLNGDLSETVYMHQPPGFVDARQGSQVAYLLIYVDDIIHTASSPTLLQQIIDSLHNEFDITDLGALNYFLSIFADRNTTGLFLSQKKYALHHFERAHMVLCNLSRTPVDTEFKMGPDGIPVQDPTLYRSLAEGYNILHLHVQIFLMPFIRCTLGYCVFLGDNLLSLSAKRQHTLSHSSVEAEYRGVANVVAETAWLRNLLRELHSPLPAVTLVYCDNVSAIYMSANPVQHQRIKHTEIDIYFFRDMVIDGQVRVLHVPSRYQYADIFTKGLPSALFEEFRSSLSVHPSPALTAGAY